MLGIRQDGVNLSSKFRRVLRLAGWNALWLVAGLALVVLVFVPNDFINNFPLWRSIQRGLDPEHLPYVSAVRAPDGSFRLRPPDPDYRRFRLPQLSRPRSTPPRMSFISYGIRAFLHKSYFWTWWGTKRILLFNDPDIAAYPRRVARAELLSRRPAYASLLDGWRPVSRGRVHIRPANEDPPSFFTFFREGNTSPFYKEALAFTAFGLDEFKERAERDGAALVILATHRNVLFGGGGTYERTGRGAGYSRHQPNRRHLPPGRRPARRGVGARRPLESRRPPVGCGSPAGIPEAEPRRLRMTRHQEARRRTTCRVFSADPVDVQGYTRLGETIIPVKN